MCILSLIYMKLTPKITNHITSSYNLWNNPAALTAIIIIMILYHFLIFQDFFKLTLEFDGFYTRNIYRRVTDCFNRAVGGVPGAYIDVLDRTSDDGNWTFK